MKHSRAHDNSNDRWQTFRRAPVEPCATCVCMTHRDTERKNEPCLRGSNVRTLLPTSKSSCRFTSAPADDLQKSSLQQEKMLEWPRKRPYCSRNSSRGSPSEAVRKRTCEGKQLPPLVGPHPNRFLLLRLALLPSPLRPQPFFSSRSASHKIIPTQASRRHVRRTE